MMYSSPYYLFAFLPLTLIVYQLIPRKKRWIVLLAFSIWFYMLASGHLIVFLMFSALSVYVAGRLLETAVHRYAKPETEDREQRKLRKAKLKHAKWLIVLITLLINFGLLAYLKYYNFFAGLSTALIDSFLQTATKYSVRKLTIPMGISFYTLMAVSYVIDVSRERYEAEHNYAHLLLFLVFFPEVVEGPIGNYGELKKALFNGTPLNFDSFRSGVLRIIWGCFLKITIADRADMLADQVFNNYGNYSGLTIVLAMLVYTLQLYADFAGCIDIAAGSAELFGIQLTENFRQPFAAETVEDFWRRWHISLGTWFREYVYYPLSLSKGMMHFSQWCSKHMSNAAAMLVPTVISLLVTWILTGLWHGTTMKYVVYGLYYFVIILSGILLSKRKNLRQKKDTRSIHMFRRARTFVFVNIGMMLFRADSFNAFLQMFSSMFKGVSLSSLSADSIRSLGLGMKDVAVLGIGIALMCIVGHLRLQKKDPQQMVLQSRLPIRWGIYIALILLCVMAGAYGYMYAPSDFIYASF